MVHETTQDALPRRATKGPIVVTSNRPSKVLAENWEVGGGENRGNDLLKIDWARFLCDAVPHLGQHGIGE